MHKLAVRNPGVMRSAGVTKLLILSVDAAPVLSVSTVVYDDVNWAPIVWLVIHVSSIVIDTHAGRHVTCKLQYY